MIKGPKFTSCNCAHGCPNGAEHFAQIVLPKGRGYKKVGMGSGSFTGTGIIQLEHKDSYGALFYVAYGPYGMIE